MNIAAYDTMCIVACASMKAPAPAPAGELYISPLFRKSFALAKLLGPVLIASAEHGLVEPEVELAPYNTMLSDLPIPRQVAWGREVARALHDHFVAREVDRQDLYGELPPPNPLRAVYLFGGELYARHVMRGIADLMVDALPLRWSARYLVHEPLKGMSIGRRLQFLNQELEQRAARAEAAQS